MNRIPRMIVGAVVAIALTTICYGQAAKNDDLVSLVINLINDQDKDIRALGLEQVRTEAKGAAATKAFAEQLPKLSPDAQVGLLGALADRADAAARPGVVSLLDASQNESVRVAAIASLGTLGDATDTRRLVALLVKSSAAEQKAARASLVRLRGDAAAVMVGEMKTAATPVRVALIEVLTTRRAKEAVPDLLACALEKDAEVRKAAMVALGQLAGLQQLSGMVKAVLQSAPGAERAAAEKAVMLVCARIEPAANRATTLLDAIKTLEPADQLALLPTVGRVGGAAALPVVEVAIKSADKKTHEIGVRAICNWPDASVATRLVELAQSAAEPELRGLARQALIRVTPLPDGRTDEQRLESVQKTMPLCTTDAERVLLLQRCRAVRSVAMLRYVLPYIKQPAFAPMVCETIVELAHHRTLREPNKAEFDKALDAVIQTSRDATVIERANRYKKNQTWAKPMPAQ